MNREAMIIVLFIIVVILSVIVGVILSIVISQHNPSSDRAIDVLWDDPLSRKHLEDLEGVFGRPQMFAPSQPGIAIWIDPQHSNYSELAVQSNYEVSDLGRSGVLNVFIDIPLNVEKMCDIMKISNAISYRQISNDIVVFTDTLPSANALIYVCLLIAQGMITSVTHEHLISLMNRADEDPAFNTYLEESITLILHP